MYQNQGGGATVFCLSCVKLCNMFGSVCACVCVCACAGSFCQGVSCGVLLLMPANFSLADVPVFKSAVFCTAQPCSCAGDGVCLSASGVHIDYVMLFAHHAHRRAGNAPGKWIVVVHKHACVFPSVAVGGWCFGCGAMQLFILNPFSTCALQRKCHVATLPPGLWLRQSPFGRVRWLIWAWFFQLARCHSLGWHAGV